VKVRTISVTYGRKINLGNYNSCEIGLSIWADLDEGENPHEAVETLQADARHHVRRAYLDLKKQAGSGVNGTLPEPQRT
jgi:hypothetical protein